MTVIELIRLLRKVENKGKEVRLNGFMANVKEIKELENEIILK